MCWVGRLNPLPAAGVGPLPSGVGFAAVEGGRSHTLDSWCLQHSGYWVIARAVAGMIGIGGTADIVILGTQPTPLWPVP
jgi:hypothetical protein